MKMKVFCCLRTILEIIRQENMSENQQEQKKVVLEWGYDGEIGPSSWSAKYPLADGKHQSPIDIITENVGLKPELLENPLTFTYDHECFRNIVNTGSSFKVSGTSLAQSNVAGGPLSENHNFLQFHAHWGVNETVGSEHLVDGKSYAAEIHFVNWNSTRYQEANQAAGSNNHDGLAVLGVFVEVGQHNEEFDKIIKALASIPAKGAETTLEDFDYHKLFPTNLSYWTYQGSLTTPPCTESVQWIVFKEPIQISLEQLNACRNIYVCSDSHDCCDQYRISQNFRPVCALNNREVFTSSN